LLLAAGVFSGADVNTDVGAISVVNVLFTVPADLVSVRTTCARVVRVVGEIPRLPTLGDHMLIDIFYKLSGHCLALGCGIVCGIMACDTAKPYIPSR
jgi:hypothetical protein